MAIKEIFDLAKQHPYIGTVALLACLSVSGYLGVIYKQVSDERLEARQERLTLMDERLKAQEDAMKRQRHVNKYVQEQLAALRTGFSGLPPAIESAKSALDDGIRTKGMKTTTHARLSEALAVVERQTVVLKTAIENSEALQKALEPFLSGAAAEAGANYAMAAEFYLDASKLGLAQAEARLARLYLSGKGVEMNADKAKKLYERAALKGALDAKFDLADIYLAGRGVDRNPVAAAAYLAVEPSSAAAVMKATEIASELTADQKVQLEAFMRSLEYRQAVLTSTDQ